MLIVVHGSSLSGMGLPMCAYHTRPHKDAVIPPEDALIEYLAQVAVQGITRACVRTQPYTQPYTFTPVRKLSDDAYSLLLSLFGSSARGEDPLLLRPAVRDKFAALVQDFLENCFWKKRKVLVSEVGTGIERERLVPNPIRGPAHYFYVSNAPGWTNAEVVFWVTLDAHAPVGLRCVP